MAAASRGRIYMLYGRGGSSVGQVHRDSGSPPAAVTPQARPDSVRHAHLGVWTGQRVHVGIDAAAGVRHAYTT